MEYINIKKVINTYGDRLVAEIVAALQQSGSQNIYKLLKGDIKEDFEWIAYTLTAPQEAYYASEGRAAGKMPPIEPIENWCASRGIDKKYAFPIAYNIGKFGTKEKASHFLALFKTTPEFDKELHEALVLDIKKNIKTLINK